MKKNLEDVKDVLVKSLENVKVESGKESTQRIVGSILKKHYVDFDHITQTDDCLSIYKKNTAVGNVLLTNETALVKNNFGKETKIEYDVFKELDIL